VNIDATARKVMGTIDVDELVKVALDLGNIDSPTGSEGPVADYVHDWLTRQGFAARKVGLLPDRPNVIGTLPGTGHGRSLVFNSHMDTTIHTDEYSTTRRAADPVSRSSRSGRSSTRRRIATSARAA
jgi:acetylornithine deacetylase/succinyl-diaminopimelate desuccinylase-like protein